VSAALIAATAVGVAAVLGRGGVGSGASALSLRVSGNALVDVEGGQIRLARANDAGAQYAYIHGTGVFDGPSDAAAAQALAIWHVQVVRIPLNEDCWARDQRDASPVVKKSGRRAGDRRGVSGRGRRRG
jgi:hypothetical protein